MSGIKDLSESVVMLMEGFFAVTAVLDPHRRFLPALAASVSLTPRSELAGDILLLVKDILRAAKAFGVVLWKQKDRENIQKPHGCRAR